MKISKETIESIFDEYELEILDIYIAENILVIELPNDVLVDDPEELFASIQNELFEIENITISSNIISIEYDINEELKIVK